MPRRKRTLVMINAMELAKAAKAAADYLGLRDSSMPPESYAKFVTDHFGTLAQHSHVLAHLESQCQGLNAQCQFLSGELNNARHFIQSHFDSEVEPIM